MKNNEATSSLGCAAMIIAAGIFTVMVMWAIQGFPGLPA